MEMMPLLVRIHQFIVDVQCIHKLTQVIIILDIQTLGVKRFKRIVETGSKNRYG